MRTREEQIDSLYYGHNRYSTITQDAFRNHLIEAERRAEQRVRAEILHRVTSDENKDRYEEIKEYAEGMSKKFWSTCLKLHPDQDYSSLSAVSIFRCGYNLGAKETQERIGRDSERLDWLGCNLLEVRVSRPKHTVTIRGPLDLSHFRKTIDAEREVG